MSIYLVLTVSLGYENVNLSKIPLCTPGAH